MKLKTVVRDCLYLNWALPSAALPEPPAPLRYEEHEWQGASYAFVSALLFRQQGMRLSSLVVPRLSHPQLNLRFYVFDGDGLPAVLFDRLLVPGWVVPAGRWLARQPLSAARFDYPQPSQDGSEGPWRWSVEQRGRLTVEVRAGAPAVGEGPPLGSWEASVRYFRQRSRGYARRRDGLRRIEVSQPQVPASPVVARVVEGGLVEGRLGITELPPLHSAFLCPEIPFVFELHLVPETERLARRPVPVAADPAMLRQRTGPRRAAA